MVVLGLNAYHGDSAACLIRDGVIIAAAEEERFRRIKHWAGFPSMAIDYCLQEVGIDLSEVDIVAVNSNPNSTILKKVAFTLAQRPGLYFILDRLRNQAKRQSIEKELSLAFPGVRFHGKLVRVEHHLAHLASAFLVSPFEEAAVASIDGFGDFSSGAWGVGRLNNIDVKARVYFPHSLGIFYQALTQYLGFPNYGDEYKVMGLAPYGKPRYLEQMRKIVHLEKSGAFKLDLQYFIHHRKKFDYAWENRCPHVGKIFSPALEELLGTPRSKDEPLEDYHRDLARSVQAMYEEAFFHLINSLQRSTGLEDLALSGGCAMNSVANGKVLRNTNFKRLYVQSAAGDAGGAVGAAVYAWHELASTNGKRDDEQHASCVLAGRDTPRRFVMDHAYLGPSATAQEIEALLEERSQEIAESGCDVEHISDEQQLCHRTAESVAAGDVVGWFQGRMEWGPRALGNRSIVGDPRRADMKGILNQKIKRRESFRPFAPSVLREHVAEWFEEDDDVPFMMQVYQIREDKRALIPAVTHVDGSGRLQSVYKQTNLRYWNLIDTFRRLTGVPMVLNTSFNENEPVVCRPKEALDCFLRTKMDLLVLGDYLIRRVNGQIPTIRISP